MVSIALDHDRVMAALQEVPDPEMPISIVDLGLVEDVRIEAGPDGAAVTIDLLPTFVGCPALDMIRDDVVAKVGAVAGVERVVVTFLLEPAWSVDRISDAGRASLRTHGVTVPERGGACGATADTHDSGLVALRTSAVPCPFCGSTRTRLDSAFGPTRCRMIHYCDACRNTFEHMKRL